MHHVRQIPMLTRKHDAGNIITISLLISTYKGYAAQASEKQQRQVELESLRQQAFKAEQLEVENGELRKKILLGEIRDPMLNDISSGTHLPGPGPRPHDRAEEVSLENTVRATSKQPCVHQEEYESLKSDYGKLVVSHRTLQEKYRRAKEISKAWREYDDKQKVRQAEKRIMAEMRAGFISDPHYTALPDCPPGQAESPHAPCFSNETIDTPRSLSMTPKPLSPTREAISGIIHKQCQNKGVARSPALVEIGGGNHPIKEPAAKGVSADEGQSDATQMSHESRDPQVGLQQLTKSKEMGLEGRISEVSQGAHHSDCPVFMSERPVKRKRPVSAACREELYVHAYHALPPGSVAKPIRVKSEQNSSSPVVQVILDGLDEVQDTLDLDEVGDRALTPRKRRRLQQLRIRSQGFNPSTPTMMQQVNGCFEEVRPDFVAGEETTSGHEGDHNDLPFLQDRAYYVKLGEEHGLKLWNDERRKVQRRQDAQADNDATVMARLRGSKDSTLARQQLHNRRVHARQAKTIGRQDTPLQTFQQATPTHQARRYDGLGTVKQEKLNCEQALRASSEPIEALKSQKQVNNTMMSSRLIGPTALRPTNANAQVLPRTSEHLNKKRTKPTNRRHDRGVSQIPFLAEDGEGDINADEAIEFPNEHRIADGSKSSGTAKATDLHYRLGTLLAKPSPQKPQLGSGKAGKPPISQNGPDLAKAQHFAYDLSRSTSNPKISRKTFLMDNDETLRTPQLSAHNNSVLSSITRFQHGRFGYPTPTTSIAKRSTVHRLPVAEIPDVVMPDDEPLRARPLRRLRLDDFKINPASNQGYDYAFDEVVRSRDQRKCLPNCTRPECCGTKFEKLVELGGFVTPRKPGLWSSSPVDEADEEVRLLEEYLGYDHTRINCLAEDEKRKLVIQAKANQFANEHGRHRLAYERNTSPPGFWRTDMPTTQELEEDRKAAHQVMRRKLEDRYKEAMRPGGRWMFRDE